VSEAVRVQRLRPAEGPIAGNCDWFGAQGLERAEVQARRSKRCSSSSCRSCCGGGGSRRAPAQVGPWESRRTAFPGLSLIVVGAVVACVRHGGGRHTGPRGLPAVLSASAG
jgi:hypothetical protein